MPRLELFGTATCPYTRDLREWLEMRGTEFDEYDVETDPAARERMRTLAAASLPATSATTDRMYAMVDCASSGVALRPVPMAQIGS